MDKTSRDLKDSRDHLAMFGSFLLSLSLSLAVEACSWAIIYSSTTLYAFTLYMMVEHSFSYVIQKSTLFQITT